jgi:hypothetical protein
VLTILGGSLGSDIRPRWVLIGWGYGDTLKVFRVIFLSSFKFGMGALE